MKTQLSLRTAIIASVLMLASSGMAYVMKPTVRIADSAQKFELANFVPTQFGEWREEVLSIAQVVNPQQKAMLDQLYAQLLTRTYINSQGQRIMLSIAYGGDQTDNNQVHSPEVCYPAQGFQLQSSKQGQIVTPYGDIPVKRMTATLGQRNEPVTYWVSVGNKVVRPGLDKKIEEMKYGMRGTIPDGMLFRVSSIDRNETAAFAVQDSFVQQLLANTSPQARLRLAGLTR